jgi:competence protein ComEA
MEAHTTRAGFTLAVGLFVWAVSGTQEMAAACRGPVEHEAAGGYTTIVACDGEPSTDAALRGPARRLFGHRVDLNCSDPLTLQTLKGIGPARAQAIIDERSRGRFRRVDDLTRVRGIGPRTLARLRGELVVENGPASVESAGCRTDNQLLHPPAGAPE